MHRFLGLHLNIFLSLTFSHFSHPHTIVTVHCPRKGFSTNLAPLLQTVVLLQQFTTAQWPLISSMNGVL
ncbi:hypothetical protein RIF29_35111 [Crotalaria pallida]|uniref:Secreted protein n=1 Tax=Crotalaria pallida TaxID=3830 RepID=A0AAN9HV05_CROPI